MGLRWLSRLVGGAEPRLSRLDDLSRQGTTAGAEARAFLDHRPHCVVCREGRWGECPDGREALSLIR
jgi:hypothetical protein